MLSKIFSRLLEYREQRIIDWYEKDKVKPRERRLKAKHKRQITRLKKGYTNEINEQITRTKNGLITIDEQAICFNIIRQLGEALFLDVGKDHRVSEKEFEAILDDNEISMYKLALNSTELPEYTQLYHGARQKRSFEK